MTATMIGASFAIEYDGPEALIVRDTGLEHLFPSIEADAEGVFERLNDLRGPRRLFFIDRSARTAMQEILVKNGEFAGVAYGAPHHVWELAGV
jgi:hypothetical protein